MIKLARVSYLEKRTKLNPPTFLKQAKYKQMFPEMHNNLVTRKFKCNLEECSQIPVKTRSRVAVNMSKDIWSSQSLAESPANIQGWKTLS